ncbi:MAG: YfiR family protein [Acidobacteria bacterium]|nr:YfiR family protein [Acidobacteriota bacterium]
MTERSRAGILPMIAAAFWLLLAVHPALAENPQPAALIKAALLFNFAKFIEWDSSPGPLTLGVLGDDGFAAVLEEITEGKSVNGRPVLVKRFSRAEEAHGSNLLFIADSRQSQLREVLAAIGNWNTVAVSDMPEFAARGGMIGLFEENSRWRFEVNMAAVQRAGIRIHSQLLRLARIIAGSAPPKHA